MTKDILCTLGPASMDRDTIDRLAEFGVSLFRINLSHTVLSELRSTIRFIKSCTDVPLCLDTEGAQIRTGTFVDGTIVLRENSVVRAHRSAVPGSSESFNLYPMDVVDLLDVGDFISIDFNQVLVQVIDRDSDAVVMRVLNGGTIGRNKAVTVERDISLPFITEKDRGALAVGLEMGIRHYALSFANTAADVDGLRAIVGDDAFVISKIECRSGLANLDEIARRSDALLIDRGDLSREVPIERIPQVQKRILGRGRALGVKVYVATNLLESMVAEPAPTRAELNDIYSTLSDGADGLVLAAETAIGSYPVQSAAMVVRMIQQFEAGNGDDESFTSRPSTLLVPPHGGRLVHREASPDDLEEAPTLPSISVSETDLMDCEQLALGTFSPLTGFMDRATLETVLTENRLPDGTVWPMPIVLQIDDRDARTLAPGMRVALKDQAGRLYALVDVEDIYTMDLDGLAQRWFGTASDRHPGVARVRAAGQCFLAGPVTLIERLPSPYRCYELTPQQTRFIFAHKSWSRVVGFHGRNPVHRAHEWVQNEALRRSGADGLFISPVIGPKKPNDFLPDPILRSYQMMLEFGRYPAGKVVLGSFSTYSRYCGPREAVFTALCRKNMGCSHFIVGRDHTGVGDFYPAEANRRMFDELGDLGVSPIFFGAVGYNADAERLEEERDGITLQQISATDIREALRAGAMVPDWMMWHHIQDMLRTELAAGRPVFVS